MNRISLLCCCLSASLCVWLFACKPADAKKDEKAAETQSTNAEGGLKIEAEAQAKMGLKVEVVSASEFTRETKCFGHVIDPSALNAAFSEINLAKAATRLSQKEMDRLKVLRSQNNASDRAVEAAEAALEKDQLTVQAATEKLQLTWGKEISGRTDLAEMAQSLAAGNRSLVRIDSPIDEKPATAFEHLRLALGTNAPAFDADFIGHAVTIDLPTQGQGFFYLASVGNDKLPIGSTVSASLKTDTTVWKGFTIPVSAVIMHDGEKWFYEQSSDVRFHRELLENPVSMASGYFVTNGVEAGARIVIVGAQQLLSEELKSQIKPD